MMKKLSLIFLLTTASLFAQSAADKLTEAFNAYKNMDYGTAFHLFKSLTADGKIDEQKLVMIKYYTADCLFNLNELDGAAEELEAFVQTYPFSSLREPALYKLGSIYFGKQDYKRSRSTFQLLLVEHSNSEFLGSINYFIGQTYFAENRKLEAEESFKKAIEQEKTNKYFEYTIYSLAQLYEKAEDLGNAVKYYDELLAYYKDGPLAPEAQMRIGICFFKQGQYDNAILELSDPIIQKLSGERLFDTKVFLANSFVRLKEYKRAMDVYSELLPQVESKEYKDKINYNLAWINFQLNDYGKAYEIFDELYQTAEDSMKIVSLFWSGECKRYAGDTKAANVIYKKFLEDYPLHSLAARAQLAQGTVFYTQGGTSADAERSLLNATISNDVKTRGKAYTLLGEMRLNKSNFQEAKKYFSEAVKLVKDDKDLYDRARFGIAVTEFYTNDNALAVKHLEDLRKSSKEFEPDKVNFYLAESYFALEKYSSALKSYNAISKGNKELKKAVTLGKGYTYFNLKDFTNASVYLNEFISNYKNDRNISDAKMRLADSYFGTKKFEKASAIYREVFARERASLDDDNAYYQYGQAMFKSGKANEAIRIFEELQSKFPRSQYRDQAQYVIGWINFQQGNFSAAVSSYKHLLNEYPKSNLRAMVYYSIGDAYFNQADYDSSISYYATVIRNYPSTQYVFDAVNGIQYAYVAKNQPDRAIDYIDQFVANNPGSKFGDQIYFKKGDLYYSIQKYDAAINAYKDFIARFPNSNLIPNAYYWIGKSAASIKKDSEAIKNLLVAKQGALKSEIGVSSAVELATIYSNKKQYSEAINVLNDVINAQSGSSRLPELLFLRGMSQVRNNQVQEAYATFTRVISDFEGNVFIEKAKLESGLIQMKLNNQDAAQKFFREVAENRPDEIGAAAQYYYGVSLFNQNNIPDAVTALVRVRSVYSGYDEWYCKSLLKLGDCYVKMKNKQQAREMYRAVLIKHSSGEYAQEAKRKMNQL